MASLYLVTPRDADPATFPATLEAALSGGEVASLLIDIDAGADMHRQRLAEILTPLAQKRGVAVMMRNDSRVAGRARADGLHVDTGPADLDAALERFHPDGIVGVGNIGSRHEAMEAGETEVDYVFFGRLDRPETPAGEPHARDLAAWWVELFEPPAVLLAGSDLASIEVAAATGAEFVALRDAVWLHPEGPQAAVAEACRRLAVVPDTTEA